MGSSGEYLQVWGYISIRTIFKLDENAKSIKVKYLIVKAPISSMSYS